MLYEAASICSLAPYRKRLLLSDLNAYYDSQDLLITDKSLPTGANIYSFSFVSCAYIFTMDTW